jgi:hypothetical protein
MSMTLLHLYDVLGTERISLWNEIKDARKMTNQRIELDREGSNRS